MFVARLASLLANTLSFILALHINSCPIIAAINLLLHSLCLHFHSFCQQNHCSRPQVNTQNACAQCKRGKWVRMKHCYSCQRCVHKFDHHCVFMGICIGQFNYKYYIVFLYTMIWVIIRNLQQLLILIPIEVTLTEKGRDIFSNKYYIYGFFIVCYAMLTILVGYLFILHTFLLLTNSTTYEIYLGHKIYYLKDAPSYPFSLGVYGNLKQCLFAHTSQPIKWEIPSKNGC